MSTIFGAITVETPKFEVLRKLGVNNAEVRKYAPQIRAEVTYNTTQDAPIMNNLNNPFRTLAGYIFGGNTSRSKDESEKVAMTAPVVMSTTPAAEKIAMTAPVVMSTTPASEKIAMTAPVVMQTGEAATSSDAAAQTPASAGSQRVMCFVMPSKYKSIDELPVPKNANVRLMEVPERTYAAIRFRGTMSHQAQVSHEGDLRTAAERDGVKLSTNPHDVQYCSYNPPWTLPWLRTNDILIPVAE